MRWFLPPGMDSRVGAALLAEVRGANAASVIYVLVRSTDGQPILAAHHLEALFDYGAALVRDPRSPMMVLVTHHVEEVPDGFTHAMLLRRGSVLASGPIDEVFTARNLSRCFGVQLEIEHRQSRWTARAR